MDWLSPTDFPAQQSDLIRKCQQGTGQWFIDSAEYRKWLGEAGKALYCPGIPGAGKTMISALIIDHLWKEFQHDGDTGIAFIYCNYNRQQEQTLGNLLASILKQLVQDQDALSTEVKLLHKRHIDKRTRPSDHELMTVLRSTVSNYNRTFIVCDALDECSGEESIRTRLLHVLFALQKQQHANILATSRPLPDVTTAFKDDLSVEIRASEGDVRNYLESHITELPKFVLRNEKLQEEIVKAIADAVDGM